MSAASLRARYLGDAVATSSPQQVLRLIRLRQGQPLFRSELLAAYGNRCAVTGTDVLEVLEAAPAEI